MTSSQLALLSAALRHTRDARALLATSPDQAWHLAGFGPECARKAALSERFFDQALAHDWTPASEEILELAISLDARAWRLRLDGWGVARPMLARWRPAHRYDRTGDHAPHAAALVRDCAERVDRLLADLWMDGDLTTRVDP